MNRTQLYSEIKEYLERPIISTITTPIGKVKPTIVTMYDLNFTTTNKEQLEFYGIVNTGNGGLKSVELGILSPLSLSVDFITIKVNLDKTIVVKVRYNENGLSIHNDIIQYSLINGKYKVFFLAIDNFGNKSYSSVKLFEYGRY